MSRRYSGENRKARLTRRLFPTYEMTIFGVQGPGQMLVDASFRGRLEQLLT